MISARSMPSAVWRKSSHSGNNGGECLEVADGLPGIVPVRDSKDPHGPALVFPPASWAAFVAAARRGSVRA